MGIVPISSLRDGNIPKGEPVKKPFQDRIIARSTREFYREGRRTPGYSLFDWLHGYFYGRWPYFYIGIGTQEHPLSKALAPLISLFSKILLRHASRNGGDRSSAIRQTPAGLLPIPIMAKSCL